MFTLADLRLFADCSLAWLALINPISKIFVVSTLSETSAEKDIRKACFKASVIAVVILLLFLWSGDILLRSIFHVQLYAFKIAGGLVLLFRGFDALSKGVFFEYNEKMRLADMSIVPLASPMIAGPAAISAALSFPVKYGTILTSAALVLSIVVNLTIMLNSRVISRFLTRINFMEASIRITGLIVATIGIQMVLDGVADYLLSVRLLLLYP
jgi:multiple antibiotic resistance protein